ncbi:arginine--tRNA ligase [Halodesulfovibrio marinisediminis]|uniref:Arginine--tRNA ligase n=1 Tax=Halodesulfovibrio marinisediminis DSM 17456 TaxID=1121457 RepID=A0A1N6DEK1_9BACT|nr:arginine--tRNA ligase [Halodesulfovibrio marinisediminis]SIN69064.1 arginyl-tRNA synthetase [Halodesulfovibrio marinisediminis DSM 17456]
MRAKNHLYTALQAIVADLDLEWPARTTIEPPKEKKFGDMAANIAMVLAKPAKRNPRELASLIAEKLIEDPMIDNVEIAGPGFLNITFSIDFWRSTVAIIDERGEGYGSIDQGKGKKVQVEYVSANPTGPLHIGHGRGAAVGDSLARLLRFAGYDVHTEYYINDAGRQMLILGQSVLFRARQIAGEDLPDPEDFYRGDYIKDIAKEVLEQHPDLLEKDDALEICREYALNQILDGIKKDLAEFRVEHQNWFSERSLVTAGAVEKTFNRLKEAGLAFEQDGALWFRTTEFGDDKDRVLRKSDGSLTYFASDIAYHDNKYDRGFELNVDIWGADHHGYVPRMRAAVEALGKPKDSFDVILIQLVNLLRNGEQIAMSTRAGQFDTLEEVVKDVGCDAARFMFLSRKSDSHLDFDLELVKQKSMDNPVYYVQYANARICSVLRKAAERGIAVPEKATPEILSAIKEDSELDLIKLLDQFEDVVDSAARQLAPHQISFYVQELASALHSFYANNPILNAKDENVIAARLCLLQSVSKVIRNGLNLVGVEAPESM